MSLHVVIQLPEHRNEDKQREREYRRILPCRGPPRDKLQHGNKQEIQVGEFAELGGELQGQESEEGVACCLYAVADESVPVSEQVISDWGGCAGNGASEERRFAE